MNKLRAILATNADHMNNCKKIFLMAGITLMGTAAAAQHASAPYLDAYTIPVQQKNAVIGKIYDRNGQLSAATFHCLAAAWTIIARAVAAAWRIGAQVWRTEVEPPVPWPNGPMP